MEVQSGTLASVQHSPSGWQLVPFFFFFNPFSTPFSQTALLPGSLALLRKVP